MNAYEYLNEWCFYVKTSLSTYTDVGLSSTVWHRNNYHSMKYALKVFFGDLITNEFCIAYKHFRWLHFIVIGGKWSQKGLFITSMNGDWVQCFFCNDRNSLDFGQPSRTALYCLLISFLHWGNGVFKLCSEVVLSTMSPADVTLWLLLLSCVTQWTPLARTDGRTEVCVTRTMWQQRTS